MKIGLTCLISIIVALALLTEDVANARPGGGFGGGHGGGARMGGSGGARMAGGGGRRSMPRPSAGRPSSVPSFHGGGGSRPQMQRPQMSRPAMSQRPSITQMNRPSGAMKPSRPGMSRPSYAGNRPSMGAGGARPSRPNTSLPSFGGGGARPGIATRPGVGGGGIQRPGGGNFNRPSGRPSPSDIGDFLGMTRPVRPGAGGGGIQRPTGPGGGDFAYNRPTRPGQGGGGIQRPTRPGEGGGIQRPTRPGQDGGGIQRPLPDRHPGTRPGSDWWSQNHPDRWRPDRRPDNDWRRRDINRRPNWANINNTVINNIHNNWNTVINTGGAWGRPRPGWDRWSTWGNSVRHNWWHNNWHNNWFHDNWWHDHWHGWPGWHYGFLWGNYPWTYWWSVPAWGAVNTWFSWAPAGGSSWQEPIYYDYSDGGNVVFEDDNVYIGGQQIATAQDFAASAADLATVPPPESEEQVQATEWMPLGTFAVSTSEKETDPSRIMQLAVDREGIISGTLVNTLTDNTQPIQGKVDRDTQRVAFRIGDNENVVAETGLYNLTQNEVQLLVHYGPDRTEKFLLVRLEAPEDDQAAQQVGG